MPTRLLAQLDLHANERPTQVAISLAGDGGSATTPSITWAELRRAIVGFADSLAARLSPGDALILCTTNRPSFTVVFLAGLRAGLRVFPVSPSLTAGELRLAAEQSSAAAIIGSDDSILALGGQVPLAIRIDDVIDLSSCAVPPTAASPRAADVRSPSSAGLLLHSSGTTGLPKIVIRTGQSLDAVAEAMADAIGFAPTDTVLACVPLCHSYGIEHGLLAPLWAGSAVRLCQGFDLSVVIAELQSDTITIFPAVPFVYEMLARQSAGERFPKLRRAYSAGGPLPDTVRVSCQADLGLTVTQLFGATEIGSVTYSNPDLPGFSAPSVGRAMKGVEIRIFPEMLNAECGMRNMEEKRSINDTDSAFSIQHSAFPEGLVLIRAASMFAGYLDGSPDTLIDGFFPTGDLGRLDAFGNLTLTGRQKLLIDVAGLKVNPLEVEAALIDHPAVAECVVVPMVVSETVSRLKAVVVLSPGMSTAGETLRQFLRERLAPYKVPRVFEFREDLPRSPAGKVLRQQV